MSKGDLARKDVQVFLPLSRRHALSIMCASLGAAP
jgi:hypothetical protein